LFLNDFFDPDYAFDSVFDCPSHGNPAEQGQSIRENDEKLFERSEFFSSPD
jgi:hypothetical protein